MFMNYSDYDFVPTQKQVDEVKSYYEKNMAQIKELQMYNDMLVEKYLKIIKRQFTVPFVFDKKFYNNSINYFKNKDKEGKQNFEYLRDTLKDYISKDIKIVDMLIMVPTISQQLEFLSFVEQTDKSKSSIQQSLDKLETLKKSLMQKYFG